MSKLRNILSHNFWAILYFNFKMLPFRQAIKLPFDFYHRIRFENLSGKILLSSNVIYRGMIKIGGRGSEMFARNTAILDIKGTVVFDGVAELGHGVLLRVEEGGKIKFGNNARIGAMSKIFCENEIILGNELDFSWECQIFDTNFHDIEDTSSGDILMKTGSILIGSHNWFGNRITIMKGTVTPEYITVASNSLCNKNYSEFPPYSVLGGFPVKLIGSNKKRIFENLKKI